MMVRHYEIDFNSGALVFPAAPSMARSRHRGQRQLYAGGGG